MAHYIDKDALVAEIESLYKKWEMGNYVHEKLISFLNTLETKEVDLGQEIKNGIDNLCNLYCYMEDLFDGKEEEGVYPIPEKVKKELIEFAKYFFELGLNVQKGE